MSSQHERIGLFGGTFNPIHACHLRVAMDCLKALDLTRICFVPAGTPPVKRADLAPARERLEMVRLATAANPEFEVSDVEVAREGPSYTLDTVAALKRVRPAVRWTLILGLDALLGIGAWHRPEAVLRACPIAVPFRPGARFHNLRDVPQLAGVDFSPLDACCGCDPRDPAHLFSADGIHLTLLPIEPCPVSGTAIRAALRKGERHVTGLPEAVEDYIIDHHLYV